MRSAFEKAGYVRIRVEKFCKSAERLHDYLVSNDVEYYTPDMGIQFVQMEYDSGEIGHWTLTNDRRAIEVLNMILAGGPISFHRRTAVMSYPGEIGTAATIFLKHLETEVRSAESSLSRYGSVLSPFSIYCHMNSITLRNIDYRCIVGYLASKQNTDIKTTSVLRIFFRYLYESDQLKKDYSLEIKDIKPRHQEKIPSFYSQSEILRIEGGIERTSILGKRNYAIVKLASRLGLRASDIASLELSSIEWERNVIKLKQRKTGKYIELPLLADVGNSLIDYILNGRPDDSCSTVFLSYACPHRQMTASAISAIISKAITDAGIDINGRRHGAHSLRHSLAYNMLGKGSTLGMISNALGHASVESTMFYMGVDIGRLMDCSLAVPPVNTAFYNQGGGLLYD